MSRFFNRSGIAASFFAVMVLVGFVLAFAGEGKLTKGQAPRRDESIEPPSLADQDPLILEAAAWNGQFDEVDGLMGKAEYREYVDPKASLPPDTALFRTNLDCEYTVGPGLSGVIMYHERRSPSPSPALSLHWDAVAKCQRVGSGTSPKCDDVVFVRALFKQINGQWIALSVIHTSKPGPSCSGGTVHQAAEVKMDLMYQWWGAGTYIYGVYMFYQDDFDNNDFSNPIKGAGMSFTVSPTSVDLVY